MSKNNVIPTVNPPTKQGLNICHERKYRASMLIMHCFKFVWSLYGNYALVDIDARIVNIGWHFGVGTDVHT